MNAANCFDPGAMRGFVNSTICGMDYEVVAERRDVATVFDGVKFGGVIDLFRYEGKGTRRGSRKLEHIRADKVDDYLLLIPHNGRSDIYAEGKWAHVGPGSFVITPLARPFLGLIASNDAETSFSMTLANVSGSALRERILRIDEYSNQPIDIEHGASKIMRSLLDLAFEHGPSLGDHQARDFGQMLVDGISSAIMETEMYADAKLLERPSSRDRIRERAKEYIERHLSNPELNATQIASYCRVSPRYVHMAFADDAISVGQFIREARLQRCRLALRNPELFHHSILEIALSWGFNSSGSFCRAYKGHFGLAPSEERSAAILSLSSTKL